MAYARKSTASKSVKSTSATTGDNLKCPLCGAGMVPMRGSMTGKGFGCSMATWSRAAGPGGCRGVIFNRSNFAKKPEVARAVKFPNITNPTDEQQHLAELMGQSPAERGGRCVITDAGPGTAKTTSTAWGVHRVYRRFGTMNGMPILTFNTNAKDVMLTKLPAEVSDIATLNGWHARAQGFKFNQYKTNKLRTIFGELVDHLPREDRPRMGILGKLTERMRDICLFSDNPADTGFWNDALATILTRFPSMSRKCADKATAELIKEYWPMLATRSHAISSTIDLQEQVSRPVWEACRRSGWRMRMDCATKPATAWTDDDVKHFAKLVRAISLPSVPLMIVDEAQDLSLCQVAVILAQVYDSGELFLIGDDSHGEPGEPGYKAGQAIYGWRGAFGGSLTLIARLWEELTGETAVRAQLTKTFRHGPAICASYAPLNSVIQSGLPEDHPNYNGEAWNVNESQAFTVWLNTPSDKTALWITRTNAPLGGLLLETLKAHKECCIRGGADFIGVVDGVLFSAAGWYDDAGEFKVSLADALAKLAELTAEAEAENNGAADPNSVERFVMELGHAVKNDPAILEKAGLAPVATVGNLKRFIANFATKAANRVLTTVYRCKGDEADIAIVGDVAKFNESWGDPMEDRACRHVAASRAKTLSLTVGKLSGTTHETAPQGFGESEE